MYLKSRSSGRENVYLKCIFQKYFKLWQWISELLYIVHNGRPLEVLKYAMPVSFKSELFTSYNLTIFKQCNIFP